MGTEALLSMRGWLLKRKGGVFDIKKKSIFCTDFNKRFFWIDSSIRLLYYSESQDKSKRVSFIPFNKLVSVCNVTEPLAINSARPGWVYGLEVRTSDRAYELWARSPAEARRWLEVLEKAASIGRGYMSSSAGLSFTSRYLDTVSPLAAANGSRRTSSQSGGVGTTASQMNPMNLQLEQANTVPVVTGQPLEEVKENTKENTDKPPASTKLISPPPVLAPTKWDDWDR